MGIAESRNLASALHLRQLNEKVLWRINRLRTMTPAEIRHRVVQAAHIRAERWGFAKCIVPAPDLSRAASHLERSTARFDAIIVADYGKGFVTQPLAECLCRAAAAHKKILAIDPHPHTLLSWPGATTIKPNRAEAFQAAGLPPSEPAAAVLDDRPLLEAGGRLLNRWNCGCLLITLGEQGMLLLERDAEPYYIPAKAREVFDVSGAGDTAIAVFTLGLSAGATPAEAAELANQASGVAVGKVGTATVTCAELQGALS